MPSPPCNSSTTRPSARLDGHTVTGRARVSAGASVDIRDNHGDQEGWAAPPGDGSWNEVQDPGAAVALDERVVAADLVEHLRTEPHVADGAEAVAGFGDRDALAALRHRSKSDSASRESIATSSARAAVNRGDLLFELVALGVEQLLLARDFCLLGLQPASAVFTSAASVSACSMCSRSLSSWARTSCSATAISFCIAWYSLLVLTSISCPLYLDSRP